MLQNWTKILVFNLKRNKLFTLLTVVGLSFGICVVLLASLYWKQEHAYDQWNPDKDLIYEVLMDMGENKVWSANVGPLANQMKESSSDIVDYLYYRSWPYSYSCHINGEMKTFDATLVQGNFFHFFPFEIVKGNAHNFAKKNNSIALSEEEAVRLFGKENPIGKLISNEENNTYVVTTVYKIKSPSSFTPTAIINDLDINENDWNNFNYQLLIKIKDPTAIANLMAISTGIVQKNLVEAYAKRRGMTTAAYKEKHGDIKPVFTKLSDARLFNKNSGLPNQGGNYKFLLMNIIISVMILLLSIVNQINLQTAYALKRIKEFSIRRIIGASKKDVLLQLVFETSIYVGIAITLGLALVELLLPYYNNLLQHQLQFHLWPNLGYIALLFLFIMVCSAIFPALYITKIKVQDALKGMSNSKKKPKHARQLLLVLQFVISFIFICGGIIMYKQVNFMMNKDLGFKGDQVIAITYYNYEKKDRYGFYTHVVDQLQRIKGVKEVGGSNSSVGTGSPQSSPIHYNGNQVQTKISYTEYKLLPLLGASFLAGRNFDENIPSDSINSVIINETAVHALGITNPINQRLKWNDAFYNIVGVIQDFNITGFSRKIEPTFYIRGGENNYVRNNINTIYLQLDSTDNQQTLARLAAFWTAQVDPHYPFEYEFVDKQFQRTYAHYVTQRDLFGLLNITVIAIALFGLFSLASFSIERRLKEIAIKKVLGAETNQLIKDLIIPYTRICVISFILAILPSYFVAQEWLSNFSYRIEVDYSIFVATFAILFILTLVIVIYKGYTATRINALNYLKYE